MFQPSFHTTGGGALLGSPSGAPASTQETILRICSAVRRRSLEKCPCCGSANHGGIVPVATATLIAFAHGRVCAYVSRDMGAISPARWQTWQCCCRIGTMSSLKVGVAAAAWAAIPIHTPIIPHRIARVPHLEYYLERQLHLARRAVGSCNDTARQVGYRSRQRISQHRGAQRRIERRGDGGLEGRMIQKVESFCLELNPEGLGDPPVLLQRKVHVPKVGSNDRIAARIAKSSHGRRREAARVKPGFARSGLFRRGAGIQVAAGN